MPQSNRGHLHAVHREKHHSPMSTYKLLLLKYEMNNKHKNDDIDKI